MVRHYLESITGVEIYPIISFLIFFIFFIAVTWYVIRLDKRYIDEITQYPIDDDDTLQGDEQVLQ
ncbi:MAG: cbb3-type cytochrome c oxidase subunit 3 [Marinilabiliaceae bacterium]|nr:cbb3-type cytochrome c oxidase subunit 3 [Marinilabiliaceae bacterium]